MRKKSQELKVDKLTTSVLELLCALMAFSCTFPITASAQRASEIKITPEIKLLRHFRANNKTRSRVQKMGEKMNEQK